MRSAPSGRTRGPPLPANALKRVFQSRLAGDTLPRRNSLTSSDAVKTSPRRAELLDRAYEFVLDNGLTGLSLRPLAAATGTSPRVLLYLFDSKEGLVRELLERMRREQLALLVSGLGARPDPAGDQLGTTELVERMWSVLGAPEQRRAVRLTYEAF